MLQKRGPDEATPSASGPAQLPQGPRSTVPAHAAALHCPHFWERGPLALTPCFRRVREPSCLRPGPTSGWVEGRGFCRARPGRGPWVLGPEAVPRPALPPVRGLGQGPACVAPDAVTRQGVRCSHPSRPWGRLLGAEEPGALRAGPARKALDTCPVWKSPRHWTTVSLSPAVPSQLLSNWMSTALLAWERPSLPCAAQGPLAPSAGGRTASRRRRPWTQVAASGRPSPSGQLVCPAGGACSPCSSRR